MAAEPPPSGSSHPIYAGTDYVRLQQELIAVRTRLDRQIAQLTRLNRLSNTLLTQQLGVEGLEAFAEMIPDVLDMAIGVVWEVENRQVRQLTAFGIEVEDPAWLELGHELLDRLERAGSLQAMRLDDPVVPLLADRQLCDVLVCRCMSSEGLCIAVVMAANTITLAGMFDPISDETLAVLTQVAERFAAHLDSRRSHELLDQRLQQLRESEQRLQRVMQGTNDGWWEWDLRLDTCLVSSRWLTMLGESSDEPQSLKGFWLDRIHHAERDDFSRALSRMLEPAGDPTLEREVRLLRQDGSVLPVLVRGTASLDRDGQPLRVSGTILDLTERKRHEAAVHRLAYFDALTDLPNRRGLMEQLPRSIRACQAGGQRLAVLMIDLDGFKRLNDTHGHAAGDQMLHLVGQRLRQGVRSQDMVVRLGGDEFVVLLEAIGRDLESAQATAHRIAQGLQERLARPYVLDVGSVHHSASIGVAVLDHRSATAESLMQHADVALYEAKGGGRAMVRLFDPDMQLQLTQRAQLEERLRQALQRDELTLHIQGVVDGEVRLCSAEALMRWPQERDAWISPDRFIPVAEESGLIHVLGDWSLQRLGALMERWQGQMAADFRIALNLSSSQFLHPDFERRLLERMRVARLSCRRLKLEITEATVLRDLGAAARRMESLRDQGISFSLDDFGTGYSSISYLRQLPLDEVKIDKSYVHNFLQNRSDAAVVSAVINLGSSLGISVVAEGIQNEEQWQQLRAFGCNRFQGYLFSRPMEPTADLESLLCARWRRPVG